MNKNQIQRFENLLLCESYDKITHRSGLEIYVFKKDFSSYYAILGVKYGSMHSRFARVGSDEVTELPDGVAHFLEHKLFSNEDGSDSFERFSEYGADSNAFTSYNKTAYLFSCTENFEQSLEELLRFVTHPYFTEESIASEIGIITEEIKMYNDSPQNRCYYGMLEGMYSAHSIKRNICGTPDSISKITPDMLYRCHKAFYTPSNMILTVCGNVSTETVLDIADRILPKTAVAFEAVFQNENELEPDGAISHYVEQKMQLTKPIFNIGFKDTDIPDTPAGRDKKDIVMSILNEMLFSRAGKLYNRLFEQELISPGWSYDYTVSETFAYNSIAGEADDPQRVADEILNYLSLPDSSLSYEDFLRAKRVLYSEFVKLFDSTDTIANELFTFACDGIQLLSDDDLISAVSFEDVKALYKKMFDKNTFTLSVIKPL